MTRLIHYKILPLCGEKKKKKQKEKLSIIILPSFNLNFHGPTWTIIVRRRGITLWNENIKYEYKWNNYINILPLWPAYKKLWNEIMALYGLRFKKIARPLENPWMCSPPESCVFWTKVTPEFQSANSPQKPIRTNFSHIISNFCKF